MTGEPAWRKIGLWTCTALLLLSGASLLYVRSTVPAPAALLREARRELAREQYARAEELARCVLAQTPADPWALLVAAEAAGRQQHPATALGYYLQIPDDGSEASISGLFGAGEILAHQGRLSEAEGKLRRVLEKDPDHRLSRYRLATILGISGRRWESVPHLLEVVRSGQFGVDDLVMLGDLEKVVFDEGLLKLSRTVAPDDPLPLLADARLALGRSELEKADRLLRRVVAAMPDEIEARVRQGMLLLETASDTEFLEWHARLPARADAHPDVWVVRGRWAMGHDEPRTAVRCFWEAVLRHPDDRLANYRLGQALNKLEQPEQAAHFLKRGEQVRQLLVFLDGVYRDKHDTELMHKAAILTESLGRIWEAWGWARVALAEDPTLAWAQQTTVRLERLLRADLPRNLPEYTPARQIDLSSYPLPDWKRHRESAVPGPSDGPAQVPVRFADVAAEAGIRFVYFNSHDRTTGEARMFELTGGGVAAFDFDGDGWPDLYFTQGCRWPVAQGEGEHYDCLFHNLGDGRAAEVALAAGLGDAHFSQGISAGDYNVDGFPDLYLANIGQNRLYCNNGDGTFTDVTRAAGLGGHDRWTTSCLIADLNGDSWPDLYDVTYCAGSNVFTLVCQKDGVSHACSPRAFEAAPDQIYLNRGDGSFENVTGSSGIDLPNGYGLGIVAADFEGSGLLNLFIANDETANFYFVNQTGRRGGKLKFADQALASGLAFDADGVPQACMGVAAGDADGNGLIDLYVSNFYNESDTLYLQYPGRLFVDMTRQAGLRGPSFEPLGFGTQFLDGELDGLPDLVLTNGHIDDFRDLGIPYEMSPQYFRNIGGGRFRELRGSSSPGKFFDGKYLGRGLARLDWNRDGKEDFAVSHIGSPAALIVNQTPGAGHFLALQFRGVACDRDAIGTTVHVTAGGRTSTRQLTAG
ncbi:MAG: FG-GAP-like repeat-containing protein, partial [Deltaproteobacteria bacterium]